MKEHDQTERERKARDIFLRAVEMASPEERAAYLDAASANDAALRARVESLLSDHSKDSFLEMPAARALGPGGTIRIEIAAEIKPGDRIGRYKLIEQIGEGGCGIVYVAEQEQPVRRRVALKVIKLGMDTRQVIARFEAERQALALMDHPNIAKVLDAGATENGRPFFVMELVKGVPITRYCDEHKLSTQERLILFIQICQAVQHAHQKGIIHRDIKPSNILVADHDGVPVPKVIDFGIAKATTDQRLTDKTLYTAIEQFIGTPAYMSPEQANLSGLDVDTRSDIYSLGVLLYELLTGKTPFEAKRLLQAGLDEIRRIIREEEPTRPSTRLNTMDAAERTTVARHRQSDPPKLAHLISGDLDWIVMKCLEKDRARRYETANGLGADLKRHLNNEPVSARPPSASYKFQKAIRRNKLVFGAGAAVLLALLAGLAVAVLGWRQTRVERDKARKAQVAAQASSVAAQEQRRLAEAEKAKSDHLLYVANMNLVQQAWEQNNLGRMRRLLEETATNTERGFEWYYWQRQAHLEIKTLRGHSAEINSVAFSPDGQRIVTGSDDHTAKVWEAATGKELFTLQGISSNVNAAAYSPDGRLILTGSSDGTAKVWDAAVGKELLTLEGHRKEVFGVAFSPDSRLIITGSQDGTAMVWEAGSGKKLLTFAGQGGPIMCAAFSPDGQRIVTGSGAPFGTSDSTAKVWDAANGKILLTLQGHRYSLCSVAYSPNGQRIVTSSRDWTGKVWDAETGTNLLTLKGHGGIVGCAAFSPNGRQIVTGSDDQTAKVWDAASGKELLTFKGHSAAINCAAYSPDGRRIVTSSGDFQRNAEHVVKVWDAAGSKVPLALKGHSNVIYSAAFSPDGQRIVTASGDKTAKVWDTANCKELLTLKGHTKMVFSAAYSPDGQRIVTASGDKTAKVWDADVGSLLLTLEGHTNGVWSAVFSPDGRRIATGSLDKTAKVWEAGTGRLLLTLEGHTGEVWSAAFSPDGRRIVTAGTDATAKVWDAATGRELRTLRGHSEIISQAAFSPDGQRIVTGSCDWTAKVWDAHSGQELRTLEGHGDQIWAVAFSPDGQRIVTGSRDATAKVWDTATGKELLTLKDPDADNAEVRAVAFSPDGQQIVTGSFDFTAKVWTAATPRQVGAWRAEELSTGPPGK